MRRYLCSFATLVAAIGVVAPASAALTATLSVNGPRYTKVGTYEGCPAIFDVDMFVATTEHSEFIYSVFTGDQLVYRSLPVPVDYPSGVRVGTAIKFWSSGTASVQARLDQIKPVRAVFYSNKAPLTIRCGGEAGKRAGAPLPHGETSPQPQITVAPGRILRPTTTYTTPQAEIPAPTGAHVTKDPRECAAHTPLRTLSSSCDDAVSRGNTIIVFSWQGTPAYPTVDGFHVYGAAGNTPEGSMAPGGTSTVFVSKAPLRGCYVLRAYKGALESADSQPVCTDAQ